MKVPLSWMQEFAPIEGKPDDLAATLTDLGLVVEEILTVGPRLDGVIVARVLSLAPHPEADRIQLVGVDTGDGESLQICCGAFNMAVGDLVPLATLGTTMANGLTISRRKLRGQWSNGMLCSAAELGLSEDGSGIMILDSTVGPLGRPLAEALAVRNDVVFDLDVEGNRPDALSVIGVARDLAARLGVPFSPPSPTVIESDAVASAQTSVELVDPSLCPRFGTRVIENITMGESPEWLASRLVAAGMRPINPIVDISNYVMLELGHPNHTYDLDRVPEGRLRVRTGREGEKLITLDGQTRLVGESDILVCDGDDTPIGLAGVMGGESTEISDQTTRVVVEAAVWDRMRIAKTSRRLGLRSEASTRFERGVDWAGVERALDRFCELAQALCGATVSQGRVIAEGTRVETEPVLVRVARVNAVYGVTLDAATMVSLLAPLGFEAREITEESFVVSVPSWRPDATIEADIIEEIARHHGYAKAGRRVPRPTQSGGLTLHQQARRRLRRAVAGIGFSEAMPMPFLSPADLAAVGHGDEGIALVNPLVSEESLLRTSLLPGLLKSVAANQARRNDDIRLFELGRVYRRPAEPAELPHEPEQLAVIWTGADARDAVRVLHQLTAVLGLEGVSIRNTDSSPRPDRDAVLGLHPYRSAEVLFRGRTLGAVGEIDPEVIERFDATGPVAWIGLTAAPILAAMVAPPRFRPLSVYPPSDLDLAFVVNDEVAASLVATTLAKAGGELVQSLELFDVFRSPALGEARRSLAYRIRLQALDRTLTEDEITTAREAMIGEVARRHGAELRR